MRVEVSNGICFDAKDELEEMAEVGFTASVVVELADRFVAAAKVDVAAEFVADVETVVENDVVAVISV